MAERGTSEQLAEEFESFKEDVRQLQKDLSDILSSAGTYSREKLSRVKGSSRALYEHHVKIIEAIETRDGVLANACADGIRDGIIDDGGLISPDADLDFRADELGLCDAYDVVDDDGAEGSHRRSPLAGGRLLSGFGRRYARSVLRCTSSNEVERFNSDSLWPRKRYPPRSRRWKKVSTTRRLDMSSK